MQQNVSREDNSFLASQGFPRILWKPNVRYCFHKSTSRDLFWAIWVPSTYVLTVHFHIIKISKLRSSMWLLSTNILYALLPSPFFRLLHMPLPFYSFPYKHSDALPNNRIKSLPRRRVESRLLRGTHLRQKNVTNCMSAVLDIDFRICKISLL